jgi:hypothetical protein
MQSPWGMRIALETINQCVEKKVSKKVNVSDDISLFFCYYIYLPEVFVFLFLNIDEDRRLSCLTCGLPY